MKLRHITTQPVAWPDSNASLCWKVLSTYFCILFCFSFESKTFGKILSIDSKIFWPWLLVGPFKKIRTRNAVTEITENRSSPSIVRKRKYKLDWTNGDNTFEENGEIKIPSWVHQKSLIWVRQSCRTVTPLLYPTLVSNDWAVLDFFYPDPTEQLLQRQPLKNSVPTDYYQISLRHVANSHSIIYILNLIKNYFTIKSQFHSCLSQFSI